MAEYPYSLSVARMENFFKEIPSMGIPDKVITKTLEARGFNSKNDRTIVPTLRFLGFIDDTGTPTEEWKKLRDRSIYGQVMAKQIRQAYADVFKMFPDANRRADADIRNFINAHTKSEQRMVSAMVVVFKMLCSLGDFESASDEGEDEPTLFSDQPQKTGVGTEKLTSGTNQLSVTAPSNSGMTLNLHLHLSENASTQQIKMVIREIAKSLLGREVEDEDDEE